MSNTNIYEAKIRAQRWTGGVRLGAKHAAALSKDMGFLVNTLSALSDEIARLKKANVALRDRRRIVKRSVVASAGENRLAAQIASAAGEGPISVYRTDSGSVIWRAADAPAPEGCEFIGTYDEGCDVRVIAEDLSA